jgi:hypothetical protein
MSSTHAEELLSKLKTSLPKASPKRKKRGSGPTTVAVPAEDVPTRGPRAPKLSVSLYQPDLQRLDAIKEYMQQKGFRNLSDSEALRLACRGVEIGDSFVDLYREMQREDGRRKVLQYESTTVAKN